MTSPTDQPVFRDPASQALQQALEAVAMADQHVLLLGEAGTGKRYLARHLHACSRRARGPFLAVDCSAHDAEALGTSLRGHEAGAVRGGFAASPGWFESALDGTLFLDEVQALPLQVQDELLSVLRSGFVQRIGAQRATPLNARLVFASSQNLTDAVSQGRFRSALLALASPLTLQMPALRDRKGDIVPLSLSLIRRQSQHLHQAVPRLSACAERALLQHSWPGHIRELEATLHRALLSATEGVIQATHLALSGLAEPLADVSVRSMEDADDALLADFDAVLARLGERFDGRLFEVVERALFVHAHRRCGQHQTQAARLLGVSRNVLRGRLIALGEIDARK